MTTRSTAEDATPELGPRRYTRRGNGEAPAWVVIAAGIVVVAAMLPIMYLFIRGIEGGQSTIDFLTRSNSIAVIWRTVTVIVTVTFFSLLIAVPAAWFTMRTDMAFRRVIAVALALPLVVPSFVMATTLIEAFGPKGTLQSILEPLGVDKLPSIYGLPGATLVLVLMTYPYVYLTVRGAIAGLNPELVEACRSMGYDAVTAFRRVTLPLLMPAIGSGAILAALYTLSDYGGVALMRHNTLTVSIMTNYQTSIDRTAGAAMSIMLVVFAVVLLFLESSARGKHRFDDASGSVGRANRLVHLGAWMPFAFTFTLFPVIIGVVVPLLVLINWFFRGLGKGLFLDNVWWPLVHSLQASGLAALATIVVAFPVALMSVRYRDRLSAIYERIVYIGFGLPGVVIALSLVFVAVNFANIIYQTLWLLIFAYAVLFLPVAFGALRAGLLQVNPRLEEAAESLGKTRTQAIARVTIPVVMPSIFAGAALVFLLTMKELPATLILGPTGFDTLATSIWSASSEAFFTRTAASSLILVAVAGVPTAWLVLREHGTNR